MSFAPIDRTRRKPIDWSRVTIPVVQLNHKASLVGTIRSVRPMEDPRLERDGVVPSQPIIFFRQYFTRRQRMWNWFKSFFTRRTTVEPGMYVPDEAEAKWLPIPATLDECLPVMDAQLTDKDKATMLGGPEDAMALYHHSLGQFLRNTWNLWGTRGSVAPLKTWFNAQGIQHADDMSGIILTSWHRKHHNVEIDLPGQIKHYREFWAGQGYNPDDLSAKPTI